jgi:hypothetical protein
MEFRDKQIAPPRSWEKFEEICLAIFKAEWDDGLAQKHGRKGQPQHGVDVFGSPNGRRAVFHGVQCKGKDQAYGHKPTQSELMAEIKKAEGFVPQLEHWVFATTAPADATLQRAAREISKARSQSGKFTVTVLGWEDIQGLLGEHPSVVETYYPEHAFDLRSVLDALRDLPRGEDLRSLQAHLAALRQSELSARSISAVWTPVSFDDARDLGPALMGRPLGPADVAACPLLPEAQNIVTELERAYAVRLIGEPGAGKSVCALQAARILAARGWRILRLLDPDTSTLELEVDDTPTVYIIDDAHLTPPGILRAAEERACSRSFLLTTHNALEQSAARPGSIRLDAKRAVRVIAAALRANLPSTLSVVRRVDDRVGDRPQDDSLEWRLDHAEKTADRPWQFCFILGGGWRRAAQAADTSRATGADITLAAAAIRQIASRDARCKREALLSLMSTAGVNGMEIEAALDWLVGQRLVISPEDLRCPHQRFAAVVLERILEGQDSEGRRAIAEILHAAFNDPELPLAGLQSLLHELRFIGEFGRWSRLLDPRRIAHLVDRCWSASSSEDRTYAMLALDELDSYIPDWPRAVLESRVDQLADWISNPVDPMGYGVCRLMNDVYQRDKALGEAIVAGADPSRVAAAVSGVTPVTAYNLAELMRGISPARSPDWRKAFSDALDRKACLKLAATWPSDQPLYVFARFCEAFAGEMDDFALDLVEAFLPKTEKPFTDDPVRTFRELDDMAWHVLRVVDPLGIYIGRHAPTVRMKSLAKRMCAPLRPIALAEKLSAAQKRDFQAVSLLLSFLHKASPAKYAATVAALDWIRIEATIGDDWSNMFHDAQVLLGVCYGAKASRPTVEAVIHRNLYRIVTLPPRLALMAPSTGYRHIETGGTIGLADFGHFHWEEAVGVLAYFAGDRPDLVEPLLAPHETAAGAVLSNKHPSWYQKASPFICVVRQVAPASFERILSAVNDAAAEEGWAATLKGKGDGRRTVALLVESAIGRTDGLGAVARRLRERFPHRSRPLQKDLEPVEAGPDPTSPLECRR